MGYQPRREGADFFADSQNNYDTKEAKNSEAGRPRMRADTLSTAGKKNISIKDVTLNRGILMNYYKGAYSGHIPA
jgi:hypothetical protein